MKRISIIGSGNVGTNTAFFIAERRATDVLLVDIKDGVAAGKSLDLMEAGPVRDYVTAIRGSGRIDDIAGSDIVITAVGPGTPPATEALVKQIRSSVPQSVKVTMVAGNGEELKL